jgi:Leucine-rich repeat (LRR) protein
MATPDEQKIISLLCSSGLANKKLAFQLIDTLKIKFNWEKYLALYEWLKEEQMVYLGRDDDSEFSDREEAVIRVFVETRHINPHRKLSTWDSRIYLLPNLKALDFHSNSFEEIPRSIKQLRELKYLNLNKNRLACIGSELNTNDCLEHLSLGHNNIRTIDIDFKRLKCLNYLDLAGNQLRGLPQNIGTLNCLKYLNLSNNPLKELPSSISNLIFLEKLYLYNTQISKEEIATLKSKMPNCDILYSKK